MLTTVPQPRKFPMSPQLRQILLHAKRLNHAEQLQLITHLVNHALPIDLEEVAMLDDDRRFADRDATRSVESDRPPVSAPIATAPPAPEAPEAAPRLLPNDPQYLEFRDEIAQYQQDLPD
jgi:hypothetical protein